MSCDVILLDDDEDLREATAEVISKLVHCTVDTFGSLNQLQLNYERASSSKLAFLDINLGLNEPSGLEAYTFLLNNDYRGRVFFFTGHAKSHPLVQTAAQLGRAEILNKPVAVTSLVRLVRSELEDTNQTSTLLSP